jgi:type 1 glutamine amidotransferase
MRALILFCLAALGLSLSANAEAVSAAPAKARVLIVTGFDVDSHKWEESSNMIRDILVETGRFDVSISTDKEVFASPELGEFAAVLLTFGFWKESDPSDAAKAGLLEYVERGGNLVALHFACSSFQDWKDYGVLLGRVWKKGVGGHGPYGPFTVNIRNTTHPITQGMEDFRIEDELYARLTGDEDIDVLASAYSEWSKQVEPIVFVKSYGEGRVVHNVLGHGLRAKENPDYQRLLCRGVEWAATGKVTLK